MCPRPLPILPGEQGGSVNDSSRLRAGLAQGLEDGHSGPHTWGGLFLLQLPWSPLRSAPAPPPPRTSWGAMGGQLTASQHHAEPGAGVQHCGLVMKGVILPLFTLLHWLFMNPNHWSAEPGGRCATLWIGNEGVILSLFTWLPWLLPSSTVRVAPSATGSWWGEVFLG